MEKNKKNWKENWKMNLPQWLSFLLLGGTILALVLFVLFCMDNLMHSDMSAEVILSKLLADENKLVTKDWYYSTEIRIVYSQLIMIPLFKVFSSYKLVKQISVFLFYVLLLVAGHRVMRQFKPDKKWEFLGFALIFAPLSNEYLDMMLLGCFYTSQMICTYLMLALFVKEKGTKKKWIGQSIVFALVALILGLSGLRYLASLYLPLCIAAGFVLFELEKGLTKESWKDDTVKNKIGLLGLAVLGLGSAGIGFLINKFYLAVHYSFDTTSEVSFVPLEDVPQRFLTSIKLMLEFFGYTQIQVMNPRGIVNAVKFVFFLFFIGVIIYLWKNRKTALQLKEQLLLYYFLACFFINWYMLVFTDVLQQYRYWLPVYVAGVLLLVVFFKVYTPGNWIGKFCFVTICVLVVLGSLYGELWQDVKYNDCEKRYGYMEFLEENSYDFGYATFWNASVSEYLSNGSIHVASLGLHDLEKPYEWLQPKAYYEEGFHEGKCFLLLANSEAAGMEKGDFTIMEDPELVYQDEYYSIYEDDGGMYLFTEE